ncbi:hypothetical protein SISSUDRAFT_1063922 [Sistotremastrum suecicum HHB10207 ss-3]|uniref:F-box domain-containing protein n=1 Tax=Sistotremastrum suecicum HHB10207 ss-3 TaxID=1314776 RepID=A0A166B9G6_9AGAM|nr:hypothetical protein SISSUDRAFT_1063922 [Sistotremastrum suecicum HHB10207 ss-3]
MSDSHELWTEIEASVAKGIQNQLVGHRQSKKNVMDVEEAFGQIEGRLSVLLKQQRNLFTPIGGLSDEIILEILHYCLLPSHRYDLPRLQKPKLNAALSLCTRWRRIGVNAPSLWTTICLPSNLKLFRLYRERSGTLPLSIYLSTQDLAVHGSVEAYLGDSLPQLFPRLAGLYIDWSIRGYGGLRSFLSTHIGHAELPCLISLQVEFSGEDYEGPDYMVNAPNLREYRFYGSLDHVHLTPFDNLLKFELECFVMEPGEILYLLSLLPRVEHCDISNADPPASIEDDHGLSVVTLNKLRSLSISTLEVSDMACLIRHIDLPSSATLSLRTGRNTSAAATSIDDFVGSFLKLSEGLSISCNLSDRSRASETIYTLKSNARAKIDVTHYLYDKHALKFMELESLCAHATSLTALTLHSITLPSRNSLVRVLKVWTQLADIGVCTEQMQFEKLLTALETPPGILCPKLRTLECSGTRFDSSRMKYFLQSRKDYGVPLQELKCTKGFAEPDVTGFVSLVPTLTEFEPNLSKCGFSHSWVRDCNCNLAP